jgi:Na+-driven multidrug efflux pump
VPVWVQVIPMLALFGLVLDVPVVWFCLVMTFESLVKTPFGLWRLLSGRWIHDVTGTAKVS